SIDNVTVNRVFMTFLPRFMGPLQPWSGADAHDPAIAHSPAKRNVGLFEVRCPPTARGLPAPRRRFGTSRLKGSSAKSSRFHWPEEYGSANVAVGSFTSFPPSRRVRFAPRADIRPMPAFEDTPKQKRKILRD